MERPLRGEPLGDLQPVDGMHPGEALRNGPGLVGLDTADEVPGERALLQRRDLLQRFLQIALAEIAYTAVGGRGKQFERLRLANRQECDRLRTTAGGRSGACHALAHCAQHGGQILRTH